ncbi:hypothetical protein Vadar_018157 [Vaccinium darrowii]|uniref:Uncharacterized protein n=1 Tax=Vaccinium darrowii TaxID=229202 RepID=A0ACB7X1M6_9ERIC|nr:hypothetical protein Vadar_018157 [Vaccinium darrowii]
MKQKKVVKNKKRLLDLHHKTKEVGFDGYGQSKSKKWARVDGLYNVTQANSSLMNRVLEVERNLNPKFPFFVKSMNRSTVTVVFLLKLPRSFCNLYMPGYDASVVLVDTSEEEYQTKYLAEKNVLSARWRAFSIAHRLMEGDVLIFQLIKPCEFKVYIVRTSELDEVDGAVALMHLKRDGSRHCNPENSSNTTRTHQDKGRNMEHIPPDSTHENGKDLFTSGCA